MDAYKITIDNAQIYIFLFLASGAVVPSSAVRWPTALRRNMIMLSMIGTAPIALFCRSPPRSGRLYSLIGGFVLLSSFQLPSYMPKSHPGNIGTVSGLITGFAFGMGGVGSLVLGNLGDAWGIGNVMIAIGFLSLVCLPCFFPVMTSWTSGRGNNRVIKDTHRAQYVRGECLYFIFLTSLMNQYRNIHGSTYFVSHSMVNWMFPASAPSARFPSTVTK